MSEHGTLLNSPKYKHVFRKCLNVVRGFGATVVLLSSYIYGSFECFGGGAVGLKSAINSDRGVVGKVFSSVSL